MKRLGIYSGLLCGALISGCVGDGDRSPTTLATTGDSASSSADSPTSGGTGPTAGSTSETGDATDAAEVTSTSGAGEEIFNCDPWAQDCPAGLKCMAYTDEGDVFTATKCTPVAPNPGQVGDVCRGEGGWSTGVDDCDLGLACWNINPETEIGACVALCTGTMDDPGCPGAKDVCMFWTPGIASVCLQTCEPLVQDCPVGQSCLPDFASDAENFLCIIDWSFEEGQEFDPCPGGNSCDPGLLCWDPALAVECKQDEGCCLAFCDLDDPKCDGAGATCQPFYPPDVPAPPEYANVGICGLPG